MKICIFCMDVFSDETFTCAKCRDYKGLEEAIECPYCGEWIPSNSDYADEHFEECFASSREGDNREPTQN